MFFRLLILKMKGRKMHQKNSKPETLQKKKDFSQITTQEFFEQNFENDTDSDDNEEKDEERGMILNVFGRL